MDKNQCEETLNAYNKKEIIRIYLEDYLNFMFYTKHRRISLNMICEINGDNVRISKMEKEDEKVKIDAD